MGKLSASLVWAATSALALGACANGQPSSDGTTPEHVLRFASYTVPSAAEAIATQEWANRIAEATGGRVDVEFYYQESLLPGVETLQGVADGRADAGFIAGAYYPAELPLSNVAGIPFVTDDVEAQGRAFQRLYETNDDLRQEWESQGVRVLNWAPIGANVVALTEPVDSFGELSGKEIRGYGYVSEALSLAGVNAMGIAQGEVYEALQRGVLDGTSGASLDIAIYRDFHEVAPNFYDVGFGNYAVTANVISIRTWESLPEDVQEIINRVNNEYLDIYMETLVSVENEACDELLAAQGTLNVFDETEIETWRNSAGPEIERIWAADVANSNPALEPEEFLEEYRAVLAEYEASSDYASPLAECASRQ